MCRVSLMILLSARITTVSIHSELLKITYNEPVANNLPQKGNKGKNKHLAVRYTFINIHINKGSFMPYMVITQTISKLIAQKVPY